jgi:hypothetical protein
MKAIEVLIPSGQRTYTFPFGLRSIISTYPTNIRFIKVTDYRGIPLAGCLVTVENSGADYSQTTDSLGNAAVEIDVVGTVTIRLQKDKTRKSISYTYAGESLTKTVILQPPLM